MGSLHYSPLGIRPVEQVIEHCQGERVGGLLHLQDLEHNRSLQYLSIFLLHWFVELLCHVHRKKKF